MRTFRIGGVQAWILKARMMWFMGNYERGCGELASVK